MDVKINKGRGDTDLGAAVGSLQRSASRPPSSRKRKSADGPPLMSGHASCQGPGSALEVTGSPKAEQVGTKAPSSPTRFLPTWPVRESLGRQRRRGSIFIFLKGSQTAAKGFFPHNLENNRSYLETPTASQRPNEPKRLSYNCFLMSDTYNNR